MQIQRADMLPGTVPGRLDWLLKIMEVADCIYNYLNTSKRGLIFATFRCI
jgi:hypothetical protein